jgi:hypothetical protein
LIQPVYFLRHTFNPFAGPYRLYFACVSFAMLTRTSRRSLSGIQHARRLSSTSHSSAAPIRKATQAAVAKTATESAKRPQSTVATASSDRPTPSSAFNRDDIRYNDVSPLRSRQPELDHSFVGMKGGEIFHEMMLRHDVKHICTNVLFSAANGAVAWTNTLFSWLPRRSHSTRI